MHDLKLNIWLSSSSTAVHNKTFVNVKVVFFFVSFIIIFREPIGSLDSLRQNRFGGYLYGGLGRRML